jgi:hypothetical protein
LEGGLHASSVRLPFLFDASVLLAASIRYPLTFVSGIIAVTLNRKRLLFNHLLSNNDRRETERRANNVVLKDMDVKM